MRQITKKASLNINPDMVYKQNILPISIALNYLLFVINEINNQIIWSDAGSAKVMLHKVDKEINSAV